MPGLLPRREGPEQPDNRDITGNDDLADVPLVVMELKRRLRNQFAELLAEQFPAAIAEFGDGIDQIRCEQVTDPRNVACIKRLRPAYQPFLDGCLV